MSIKIYEAYRVREGVDPFELLWDLKREGQKRARKRLTKIFDDVLDGRSQKAARQLRQQDSLFKEYIEGLEDTSAGLLSLYTEWAQNKCPKELKVDKGVHAVSNEEIFELAKRPSNKAKEPGVFDIDAWILAKYGETLTQRQWNLWALDTSIALRKYGDRFYLIPYCDSRCYLSGVLDFLQKEDRLEDFAYWNNTDKPEEISESEWDERSRVWNDLTDHDRWYEFVALDVVSWMGWDQVSPMMDVARARKGKRL